MGCSPWNHKELDTTKWLLLSKYSEGWFLRDDKTDIVQDKKNIYLSFENCYF